MVTPRIVLKKYWGYDDFRSLQYDVISSILKGKDTIGLLHTGAGKSVCYQVPAMCFEGKTIVVSPLIALMQDQVAALEKKGIMARAIYAGLPFRKLDLILDNFVNGPLKILYVSPERLQTEIFLERFKKAKVSLIAVDESHCISQWGHDFRPSYHKIHELREWHPNVPIIAVTATANTEVVHDITDKLELRDPQIIKASFERENLSFTVMLKEEKIASILHVLHKVKGSGIIYVRSRAKVEKLSYELNKQGIPSEYYHGGLNMKTRIATQERWINNKARVIVCTNAFGMGVDKPDVRFVIHADIPPSIEEYYQEAGRAGRDGYAAFAISIIGYNDIVKLQKQHHISYPPFEMIVSVYNKLCSYLKIAYGGGAGETRDIDFEEFSNLCGQSMAQIYSIIDILQKEEWIVLNEYAKKPARLKITAPRSRIVMSSQNKKIKDELITYIFRNYPGITMNHVQVDEGKLANAFQIKKEELINHLVIMHREAIIDYTPSSDQAQVIFLQDRPAKDSFTIDKKDFLIRKDRALQKIQAIQEYMTGFGCRQQFILQYFDEQSAPCGRCDICKGSLNSTFTDTQMFALFEHLKRYMNGEKALDCDEYLDFYPYNKRTTAYACLKKLSDEKYILSLIHI